MALSVHQRITWATGLELSGLGDGNIEVDFALWRSEMLFGRRHIWLGFGEAKSFGKDTFEPRDISRARVILSKFPGAVFIFATLRQTLSEKEKRRIAVLARWGRRPIGGDRWRAPILVLTAHELFSIWEAPRCWKGLGGKFETFATMFVRDVTTLCDATQQLHLDMTPYAQWISGHYERRTLARQRRRSPSPLATSR